jgi:hypothetical protein
MDTSSPVLLEDSLLLHLLEHRGHQVRFEADQWTTEFGILRAFGDSGPDRVKVALRGLEMSRTIYRRVQYVIGYSEPKLVYSLTPSGHRKALSLRRRQQGLPEMAEDDGPVYAGSPEDAGMAPDSSSLPPMRD